MLFPSCGKLPGLLKTRLYIGVMMFTACWVSYMLRVNISINILDMVVVHTPSKNNSASVCIRDEIKSSANYTDDHVEASALVDFDSVKYNWTVAQQGLILGGYFWGYVASSLLSGFVVQFYGPRMTIGITTVLSGINTLATPFGASYGFEVIFALRIVLGILAGVTYPALHALVANWAPPEEKGKFIGALMGGTFGTVVTWSLCGFLISKMGWEWAFYIPGILTLLWCGLWFVIVTDSPATHPRIDPKERDYILEAIGDTNLKKKKFPPLKSLMFSLPFWAFTVLHFGSMWGLSFQLTSGPKFVSQVLGFDLSKAGILASLPYLGRVLMGFVFGTIGDTLRKKNILSVTMIRKIFVIFSHHIPGLFLIGLSFVGCDKALSVFILTASLSINGAATITNLQNHQDLAPNYVGILYSIANFLGSMTGFITPIITAHFTKEHNGTEEWRIIFIIGAVVYCLCGVFFMLFGTGETQSWNNNEADGKTSDIAAKPPTSFPNDNYKS